MWYLELKFKVHTIEHEGYCSDSECDYTYDEKYIYPILPENIEKIEKDLPTNTYSSKELCQFVVNTGHLDKYKLYSTDFGQEERGFVVRMNESGSGYCDRKQVPFECDP